MLVIIVTRTGTAASKLEQLVIFLKEKKGSACERSGGFPVDFVLRWGSLLKEGHILLAVSVGGARRGWFG